MADLGTMTLADWQKQVSAATSALKSNDDWRGLDISGFQPSLIGTTSGWRSNKA